jgi:RNA polymerase sigma factor (sigma-70 family)
MATKVVDVGALLASTATGDAHAFRLMCAQVLPALKRYISRKCREYAVPADLALDLTHDTVLRALEWLRAHPSRSVHWGWLCRVALNVVRACAADRNRERTVAIEELDKHAKQSAQADVTDDEINRARVMLDSMPERDRSIVKLMLADGANVAQIAAELQVSHWAVYKRYERAMKSLRERLNDDRSTALGAR